MKFLTNLLSALFFAAFAYVGNAQSVENTATSFVTNIAEGKTAAAYEMTDSNMKSRIKPEQLSIIWQQMEAKFGKWNGMQVKTVSRQDVNQVVLAENDFEKTIVGFRIVLNSANQIAGFTVVQVSDKADSAAEIPANLKEVIITVHVAEGDLQGALTIPDGVNAVPVALIIAGSGPTDRNGNNMLGVSAQPYRLLAYALASKGIASLRYDKRMIGASSNFQKSASDLVFEDFVGDAIACVKTLKADKRFSGVYVIGHSEGALIGMLAAAKEPVAACIALCGAGKPIDEILKSQMKVVNPDLYEPAVKILTALKDGGTLPEVPQGLAMIFNANTNNFIRSELKYDPVVVIKTVKAPLMVAGGSRDLQIPEADGLLLMKAKPTAKYVFIEGMNHVLKQSPPDIPGNLKTYQDSKLPVDGLLIESLASFIATK